MNINEKLNSNGDNYEKAMAKFTCTMAEIEKVDEKEDGRRRKIGDAMFQRGHACRAKHTDGLQKL